MRRTTWDAVIAAEPALAVVLSRDEFDAALLAVADFVDLKSPYTPRPLAGRRRARAAGRRSASVCRDAEVRTLRRAGLVHGLGRLGVSNAIWDKPGPLGAGEWERVRMHPYLTERMLRQSAALAPLGAIAVQHRERLDGSGYPRGLAGGAISRPARILGRRRRLPVDARAAPVPRRRGPPTRRPPSCGARSRGRSARRRRGRGGAGRRRAPAAAPATGGPAGLTAREVEVLRLLARGLSSRQIAQRLVISPKTARNHIEHIYTKIGASNRVDRQPVRRPARPAARGDRCRILTPGPRRR